MKALNIVVVTLATIALVFAGVKSCNAPKVQSVYEQELRHNYEQRELGYQSRLKNSEALAKALTLRYDSLLARHDSITRQVSLRDIELAKIKGRFDNLSSNELRAKAIDEYNKAHQ